MHGNYLFLMIIFFFFFFFFFFCILRFTHIRVLNSLGRNKFESN